MNPTPTSDPNACLSPRPRVASVASNATVASNSGTLPSPVPWEPVLPPRSDTQPVKTVQEYYIGDCEEVTSAAPGTTVWLISEAYDGMEMSESGQPETGYVPISNGDTVQLLSEPAPGHQRNKAAFYVYDQRLHDLHKGWFPWHLRRRTETDASSNTTLDWEMGNPTVSQQF